MPPKVKPPAGPIHKCLTSEDLDSFRVNLVKTREMTSVIETALRQLNTQIHNLNVTSPVADAIDPIKREVRRCMEVFESAMESARSQEDNSATLIEQDRIGDALTAINQGLIAIGQLSTPLCEIRDHLNRLSDKGPNIVTEALQLYGFDKEIEVWDTSMDEWVARMCAPTWKV